MKKTYTQLHWARLGESQKAKARLRRQKLMDSWVGVHEENTSLIPLDKGMFSKVDSKNYAWLNQWNWYVNQWGYAVRFEGKKSIPMHSVVLNCKPGFQPDHINRDRLDNRINNLRPATKTQNQGNRWKCKNAKSSKYKGVYFSKTDKRWRACCTVLGKGKALGAYDSEIAAATAYNKWASEYFGEFALLNPI